MMLANITSALALPPDALVNLRVPKKHLLEQGAPTAADKKYIQAGFKEVTWVAALKPTNIGIPSFKDDMREYLEIAVLTVVLQDTAKAARLIELIHRAIPYPLVLLTEQEATVTFSVAHKRWSQGEGGRVVIEEVRSTPPFAASVSTPEETQFIASLGLASLPNKNLFVLYQGLVNRVIALEAARVTGQFAPPVSAASSAELIEALAVNARLKKDIASLRAQATKEKQINRRVSLNLEIKRLESEQADVVKKLQGKTL